MTSPGGGGAQPGIPRDEDDAFDGWSPITRGAPADRRDALALRALDAIPAARRAILLEHMAMPGRRPGSWTRRPPGWIFPANPRLGGYLDGLEVAVTGPGGVGLAPFLRWLLVRSQALSLAWAANPDGEAARDRDRPWWPPACHGMERYLPGAVPALAGGGGYRYACCPFHDDRTPSFAYVLEGRQWHCYGCGVQETHWSLVARVLGLEGREAVDLLRRSVGYRAPPWQLPACRRNRGIRLWGWILPRT